MLLVPYASLTIAAALDPGVFVPGCENVSRHRPICGPP